MPLISVKVFLGKLLSRLALVKTARRINFYLVVSIACYTCRKNYRQEKGSCVNITLLIYFSQLLFTNSFVLRLAKTLQNHRKLSVFDYLNTKELVKSN